jgi:hypothetical protein
VLAVHPGCGSGVAEAFEQAAEGAGVMEEARQDREIRDTTPGASGR